MEPLSFFGRFVEKIIVSRFSNSMNQKMTQQSDGSCNATSDSQLLRKVFVKQLFPFCKYILKKIVSKEYCIAHHNVKMCFLLNSRYHVFLLGNLEQLLQKLDPLLFTYQHVHCLHTLFKYRIKGNFVVKSGQVFHDVQRAVCCNQTNTGVDRMPSIAKKETLEEKYRKHLLSSFKRQNYRKPVDQSLQKE